MIFVAATCARSTVAADASAVLAEAVRSYQAALDSPNRNQRLQGFRQAELLFGQVVQQQSASGPQSSPPNLNPELLTNWGNAALGAERLGVAVLAYRRALQLDPDHARAAQNLRCARSLLPEWVPRPEEGSFVTAFWSWAIRLSRGERWTTAAFFFLVAATLIAAGIRWQRPALRNMAILPGTAWLALMLFAALDRGSQDDGVITVEEVTARAADSVHAPARVAQPLPAGTEVTVLERRDAWCRVRLADGRDGWIQASAVEMVVPTARRTTQ
jgi:tetratricopeptide (TPR) repeat protein